MSASGKRHNGGPLDSLRVVDVSNMGASPWIGTRLADFGAEVTKIEFPRGGDTFRGMGGPHPDRQRRTSLLWKLEGRNKYSVCADLHQPEGQEIVRGLIADADIFLENYRPGRMEKWGLGPAELHAINPGLIYVRTTGWGADSPYSDHPAFGTLIEAMSGFANLNGSPDGPPTLPPLTFADYICSLIGTVGVLVALRERDQSGLGQVIHNSIFDALTSSPVVWLQAAQYAYDGTVMHRTGNVSDLSAPRGLYQAADGRWLALAGGPEEPSRRILKSLQPEFDLVDDPRFATNVDRVRNRDALEDAITRWVAARPAAECLRVFRSNGAPVSLVYEAPDLLADPHVQMHSVVLNDDDFGEVPVYDVVPTLGRRPGKVRHLGRTLGEDTERVLKDRLGYSSERISDLRRQGLI